MKHILESRHLDDIENDICLDKQERMNSDNLLNNIEFKDTGMQGLLPTTTFSGKEPEGKHTVKRESLPSKTKSPSKCKETCLDKKKQMNSDNLLKKVDSKDTGVQ
eukprot:3082860-Heterocapsa_arctica.AAC.1